jgi:hypothetical protein
LVHLETFALTTLKEAAIVSLITYEHTGEDVHALVVVHTRLILVVTIVCQTLGHDLDDATFAIGGAIIGVLSVVTRPIATFFRWWDILETTKLVGTLEDRCEFLPGRFIDHRQAVNVALFVSVASNDT